MLTSSSLLELPFSSDGNLFCSVSQVHALSVSRENKGCSMRARQDRIRILMRCSEPQAAERLKKGLDLVSSEYALATAQDAMRMWISAGYFRTER
jgi:hypothetical protein